MLGVWVDNVVGGYDMEFGLKDVRSGGKIQSRSVCPPILVAKEIGRASCRERV